MRPCYSAVRWGLFVPSRPSWIQVQRIMGVRVMKVMLWEQKRMHTGSEYRQSDWFSRIPYNWESYESTGSSCAESLSHFTVDHLMDVSLQWNVNELLKHKKKVRKLICYSISTFRLCHQSSPPSAKQGKGKKKKSRIENANERCKKKKKLTGKKKKKIQNPYASAALVFPLVNPVWTEMLIKHAVLLRWAGSTRARFGSFSPSLCISEEIIAVPGSCPGI